MSNNLIIPDTWGIPDDQANKVREALSKKSIRPEDAVQKALEEIARDIAIIEPKPQDWEWWICYLLEKLDVESVRRDQRVGFCEMLKSLKKNLGN